MILPGSYTNGFAPRDGQPLYPDLWRGCVGTWAPCLGATGLTLRDWSGLGNHGTLINGPAWEPSGGRYAVNFDGSNDYIEMGSQPRLHAINKMTVMIWASFATSRVNGLFSYGTTYVATTDLFVYTAAGSLWFQINNGADTVAGYTVSLLATDITSIVVRYDGTGATNADREQVWINGSQVTLSFTGNVPTSTATPSSPKMRLGDYYPFPGGWNMLGKMHECCIWDRALSPREISVIASRRGVMYEIAPRHRSSAAVAGFNPSWVRRRSLVIGGGIN